MRVIFVEDDKAVAQDFVELLESGGRSAESYASVEDAIDALADTSEPVFVYLDHDFGGAGGARTPGYKLCEWLRENHPLGLILPVVYLTGRETGQRFLEKQRENPFTHPTAYLSKDQVAQDPSILASTVDRFGEQFERFREVAEEQAAQQALIRFSELGPEED